MDQIVGDAGKESGINPPGLPREHLNLAQKAAIFIIRLVGLAYFVLGLEGVMYWIFYLIFGGQIGTSIQQILNQIMWVFVGLAAMLLGGTLGKLLGKDLD